MGGWRGTGDLPVRRLTWSFRRNRSAFDRLRASRDPVIVPGASHLLKAPGTLEWVARLARAWFVGNLAIPGWAEASVRQGNVQSAGVEAAWGWLANTVAARRRVGQIGRASR